MKSPLHESLVVNEIATKLGLSNLEPVASGAFKKTYRASTRDGTDVALKIIDRAKCNVARTDREISALQRCNSSRVARLFDYGSHLHSNGAHDYVVEEFLKGGTLTARLRHGIFTREAVASLGTSLARALAELRELNLVHRDVKPDNIMFREEGGDPVLVDFGLVRDLASTSLTMTWLVQGPGTPFFASPEQLNNDKSLIDWRSDQFSVGVVLAICLSGRHPFHEQGFNEMQTVEAVLARRQCSADFRRAATSAQLSALIKMVNVWPIQRFNEPNALISALQSD